MPEKMYLGGSWAPFGRGLGRSGPSFGHFSALWRCFFDVLNPSFFKHRSRMGSKRPFGSILDRFWRVLGGFWMDFERFSIRSFVRSFVRQTLLSLNVQTHLNAVHVSISWLQPSLQAKLTSSNCGML